MQIHDHVFQVHFVDRVGLGHEILAVFTDHRINLLAMEATRNDNMLLKFEEQLLR